MTHISAPAPDLGSRFNNAVVAILTAALIVVTGAVSLGAFLI
ncbi:MAG TPA: hypothetical protein VMH86_01800 [Rhizomicrobium sp.]|nr:hypothetical protein [Rhizomicrobium sp.]